MNEKTKEAIEMFLESVGVDLENEHYKETPTRVANMYSILLEKDDPSQHVKLFKNANKSDHPITLTNISAYGFCPHHLLPFYGQVAIAYIPNENVIGLSKLGRIARSYFKTLKTQEDITVEIADFIMNSDLKPKAVAIIVDAQHMCLSQRGARMHGLTTRTSHSINFERFESFENLVNLRHDNIFKY